MLVATANIAAGETYDAALSAGKIVSSEVPQTVVDANTGAVTDSTQLNGKIVSVPIFAGQVIVQPVR